MATDGGIKQSKQRESALTALGFRFGSNGAHAARTMMFCELQLLFECTRAGATRADYSRAVVIDNVLGKPTQKARELTFRHLVALYGLDDSFPVFRALRRLWPLDVAAQPMLALAVALARDPLLRGTEDFILGLPVGQEVPREAVERQLEKLYPARFSPASLKSFAQNVAGTWTAAGHLLGHRNKIRSQPTSHPETVALLLFLGYLEGRTGQRLFSSRWANLASSSPDELERLANSASHRGLIVFMNAGGVKEVRFPGYLSHHEEQLRLGVTDVV
jgi:hypothetical protein